MKDHSGLQLLRRRRRRRCRRRHGLGFIFILLLLLLLSLMVFRGVLVTIHAGSGLSMVLRLPLCSCERWIVVGAIFISILHMYLCSDLPYVCIYICAVLFEYVCFHTYILTYIRCYPQEMFCFGVENF
jgi:hypothetical protein